MVHLVFILSFRVVPSTRCTHHRETGALIIHSPVVMKKGGKFVDEEFDPHSYGAMDNLFVEGTWNCEFAEEAQPEGADVILKNRNNFSAFRGTELENLLRDNNIERLFVMGFLSNVCVEETTREASELFPDMKLYVCMDGCAAKSKQVSMNIFSFAGKKIDKICNRLSLVCTARFISDRYCSVASHECANLLFVDQLTYFYLLFVSFSTKEHYTTMGSTLPLFSSVITCSEAQDYISMAAPPGGSESGALLGGAVGNHSRPAAGLTYRPRILALHGAQSNSSVTKLQLDNLKITDDDYDIVYITGGVEESEIHPDLAGLVYGPFYSWIDRDETKAGPSLITAVRDVVNAVRAQGPFDGIYGFSSGGVVAALAANLSSDPLLVDAVNENMKATGIRASMRRHTTKMSISKMERRSTRKSTRRGTMRSSVKQRNSVIGAFLSAAGGGRSNDLNLTQPLFQFVVLACPAISTDLTELRRSAGINQELEPGTIPSSSFHIIGIED